MEDQEVAEPVPRVECDSAGLVYLLAYCLRGLTKPVGRWRTPSMQTASPGAPLLRKKALVPANQ